MRWILIIFSFVLGFLSAHAERKSYTINDMFTISVDSKLELRDKNGLYEQKTKNNNLPVTSDDVIVFQQAGLNNDKKAAYQKYARIMIQTENGNVGDFSYYDGSCELSDSDIVNFNRLAYQELSPQMHMTIKPSTKGFFLDNGIYCIMTSYQRSGVYGNVDVCIYYFFNDNQWAKVLCSYKNSEEKLWKKVMENAIESFKWTSEKGDGVTVETIDSASVSSGVHSDMTSSGKPINDALVVVVLTIAAVFICVWLLNTNKLKCKTKWGIFCLMLVLFGLVIFIITRIDDAYISKLPPPNDPELELAVEGANEQFPLQITEGIVLKSLELKDSALVSTMEIDEKKYPFEDFLRNKELKKRLMMANIANSSPFEACSYEDFADKGYSAKMVIKGIQSHREIVLVATPNEIKNAKNMSSTPREQLDLYLNSIKRNLPNKVDDGLTFSDVDVKGKQFLFIYIIDETMYDMKEVAKNKNEFKHNVEKDLKTDGEMIKLASLLTPLDMSLRVSYVGSMSKEKVNIDITPAYLKEVVSDNRISNHFK